MLKTSKLLASIALASTLLLPMSVFAEAHAPAAINKIETIHGTSSAPGLLKKMSPEPKINLRNTTASSTKSTNINVMGILQSVSGTSLSITVSSSTVYTVDTTNAKLLRKYGATMQLGDMQTGDSISVMGKLTGTTIVAKTIRDMSQQQRNANFSGTVSSVSASSFVLATKERGNQTINITSATTFKEQGLTSVTMANVVQGENVEASGVWDSTHNTVQAATVIIVVRNGTTSGIFQSVSGNTLTMASKTSSSTIYSVDVTNAKLIRRYGAAMNLADIQAGDMLSVTGLMNGLNITAKTVRNESLQAHNGTFVGTISAISGTTFTLQSKERGSQTINTASTTVFKLGNQTSNMASLAVGQTVTVSGVWDRTNSNVTANRVTIKVLSTSITGALQSISGNTLTVTASTTSYTVDATKANITYKNGHKGDISIFQANDQVTAHGQMVSGSTNLVASMVRDLSQTYKKPVPSPTPTPSPSPTPVPSATPTPSPT